MLHHYMVKALSKRATENIVDEPIDTPDAAEVSGSGAGSPVIMPDMKMDEGDTHHRIVRKGLTMDIAQDMSLSNTNENQEEDPDLKLGKVEAPYSSGAGVDPVNSDDMSNVPVKAHKKLGRGVDPYRVGKIYSYDQLAKQHQHEIDINWKNKKTKEPTGRHFMWLRTSMPIETIVSESRGWYERNRNVKWGNDDHDRVATLADLMLRDAVITPLLVSPPGETNGGLWEGYHRLRAFDMLAYKEAPVLLKIDPTTDWQSHVAAEHQPWFCIDLDGTILQDDPKAHKLKNIRPPLGEPLDGVAEVLARLGEIGRVSIWTARQYFEEGTEWQDEIKAHLKHHKIPFDDIYVGKKPPADVFVDDKAVSFDGDWSTIEERVHAIMDRNEYKEEPIEDVITMEAAFSKGAGHSGTFLALQIPEDVAKKLAVEGGESIDDMHVTLFYKKGLTPEQAKRVQEVFDDVWPHYHPIEIELDGKLSRFEASESSDNMDVLYAPILSDDIHSLRQDLLERLAEEDIHPSDAHPDYKPHITIKYVEPGTDEDFEIEPVSFDISAAVFSPGGGKVAGVIGTEESSPDGDMTDVAGSRDDLSVHPDPMLSGKTAAR